MDLLYAPAVLCAALALAFAAGSAVLHARVSTRRWPWTGWWRDYRSYRSGRHHAVRAATYRGSWQPTMPRGAR